MEINIFKGTTNIGNVSFEVVPGMRSRLSAVAVATVPDDIALETEINAWLQNNPEDLIIGTVRMNDLGLWGDGILAVLHTLGERHGFNFDRALIPLPNIPADSVT